MFGWPLSVNATVVDVNTGNRFEEDKQVKN